MSRAGIACLATALLVAAAAPAWADRIVTLAGATLVGRILEDDAEKVVIRTDGGSSRWGGRRLARQASPCASARTRLPRETGPARKS